MEKLKTFSSELKLEQELESIAESSSSDGFHYLVLECTDSKGEAKAITGQFLLLPSYHLLKYVKANEVNQNTHWKYTLKNGIRMHNFYMKTILSW